LITFASATFAESLEKIRERGVLRVAVYNDYLPFSYKQKSRISGVDVEIAQRLGERLGFPVSLMPFTADESMGDDLRNMVWKGHYLGTGVADIMMHVPFDPVLAEQNDRVKILAPYYRERVAVIYDKQKIEELSSLNVFRTHKVGVELDALADHYLTGIYGGALRNNVVHYMTADEAVKAMLAGEISAVMGPLSHVEGVLPAAERKRYLTAPVQLAGVAVSMWDVGVAVKSGSDDLAAAVSRELTALVKDGTIPALFEKHGLTHLDPGT
jgi:ABC-type amino acid transport substrate-binding protein